MSVLSRFGRGSPHGGEFGDRDREQSEVTLTRAERDRQGKDPMGILTDTVLSRCPDAVSWSARIAEGVGEARIGREITVEFPTGDTITFRAIPGDEDDQYINDALDALGDSGEINTGEFRVDLRPRPY